MFYKSSRSCALSNEAEKGSFIQSPLFRFLSFAVCLAFMLGIFTLIPFPASASSSELSFDVNGCSTINGFPIVADNTITNSLICGLVTYYNYKFTLFCVCKSNDNYYICDLSKLQFVFIEDKTYMFVINNKNGVGKYNFNYNSKMKNPSNRFLDILYDSSSSKYYFDWFGAYSYIDTYYDWSGNDCTSSIDTSNCSFYWVVNPNHFGTPSSTPLMTMDDIFASSDGSGFYDPNFVASTAHFACFDDYEDYTLSEFSTNLSNGSYMTKRETLNTGHTRVSFLFSDINTARSWQSVYNTPKMPLYTSKEISFNYYNGNIGGSSIYLKISKAQFMPNVREDDNLLSIGYFVMRPANTLIENYCQISGGSLNGCEPGRTYTYKINLQGFCDLNYNSFYCIEIFEAGNSTPLTSCVYVYGGEDTLQQNSADKNKIEVSFDVSDGNNTGTIVLKPDENGQMGVTENMVSDDTFSYSSYNFNNMDVSQIFGTLQQSTSNIGLFFNACYNIIPYSIIAIITAALTLLVILRILGR